MSAIHPTSPRGPVSRRGLKLSIDPGTPAEGGGSNGHRVSSSTSLNSPGAASALSPVDPGDDNLRYRHIRQRTDRSASSFSYSDSASHPLEGAEEDDEWGQFEGVEVLADVSRPALTRYTSETERQAAESSRGSEAGSGSHRGSLDLLRMSQAQPDDAVEVEVLIHQVSNPVPDSEVRAEVGRLSRMSRFRVSRFCTVSTWPSSARSTSSGRPTPYTFARISTCRWRHASGTKRA